MCDISIIPHWRASSHVNRGTVPHLAGPWLSQEWRARCRPVPGVTTVVSTLLGPRTRFSSNHRGELYTIGTLPTSLASVLAVDHEAARTAGGRPTGVVPCHLQAVPRKLPSDLGMSMA